MTFEPFPKIHRLTRECIVTEKIDGTNAQIRIWDQADHYINGSPCYTAKASDLYLYAGSRTRLITPDNDNFGFASWVRDNASELVKLGPGTHYGEWWGPGIQRGYGTKERRFSLFNVSRWGDDAVRPACCHVVPVLHRGFFCTATFNYVLDALELGGSEASPGFMRPEGIVVYHVAGNVLFKKTIEKDEEPKGAMKEAA